MCTERNKRRHTFSQQKTKHTPYRNGESKRKRQKNKTAATFLLCSGRKSLVWASSQTHNEQKERRGERHAVHTSVYRCVCVCVCHVLEEIDWRFICEIEIESVTNARANQLVCKNGICFFVFHLIFCFDSRVQNVEWNVCFEMQTMAKNSLLLRVRVVCAFGNVCLYVWVCVVGTVFATAWFHEQSRTLKKRMRIDNLFV